MERVWIIDERKGMGGAEADGGLDGGTLGRWRVRVEDHDHVVLAHGKYIRGLGLAPTVPLAEVRVDRDPHQSPSAAEVPEPCALRATARRR